MSRRDEILSKIGSIPAMPTVVVEIRKLLRNPDVNFTELAQIIKYDPGLTTNILHLANSAYFGFSKSVNSVQQGIVRLGTKRIFELAVAAAIAPMAQKAVKGYDLSPGKFWEHSVAVAIGAEQLALDLNIKAPDYTFTAGLLHDIGKIVLGTFIEVDAAPIMTLANQENVSFDEAEKQILGIDHAEVGAILLERWNLPECIVDVDRWHHQPDLYQGDRLVLDLVHVADILSMMSGLGIGNDGLNYHPSSEVAARLNLTTKVTESVLCKIMGKLNELISLFNPETKKGNNNGS
ncbi:MAG TPA: histidine kinase [Candidatus Marinimicrobia bacterium]|nr:histidine kinase [Candidatus Neomarinimicrobiota bacterium]